MNKIGWKFLDGKYKKLIGVQVELSQFKQENAVDEWILSSFFKNNPQIITLKVSNVTQRLMNEISEHFPNLKSLYVIDLSNEFMNSRGDVIHLKNLTKLWIQEKKWEHLGKCHF